MNVEGFDVILDLRQGTWLDLFRWVLLCDAAGHLVARKEVGKAGQSDRMSALGCKTTGKGNPQMCNEQLVEMKFQ